MSPQARMELTKVVAKRYLAAKTRSQKTIILNEYCANTGYNRKYAITKLRAFCFTHKTEKKRGRKTKYSRKATALLVKIWKAFDQVCGERLHPFLPEGLAILKRCGHIKASHSVQTEVLTMSVSTVKRRLRSEKVRTQRLLACTTKPGKLLKNHIPIRTNQWLEDQAGFGEIDLVAHCGGSLAGQFIYTLQYVDIKTTWTERVAVMGKSQQRVFAAIKHIRSILPFPIKGIDSDNGSEFINHQLYKYCEDQNIVFTRTRPYHSKDNAHIEQKNGSLVRNILGYDRLDTHRQLKQLNTLYDHHLRLFTNFFLPSLKLKSKIRVGSKYKRKYDKAQTPFQRVLNDPSIPQYLKNNLTQLYLSLDPITLKQTIDKQIRIIVSK